MADCEHLLIDGYNLAHHFPEVRQALRHGIEVARERLAAYVRIIHDLEGVRTTLVFDGRGDTIEIERPYGGLTFSYVFAPAGMSADDVIEQMVNNATKPERITAATRDNMVAETVRALGGRAISPEILAGWIGACERRQGAQLDRLRRETRRQWKEKRR